MKNFLKTFLFFYLFIPAGDNLFANNIAVSNISLIEQNIINHCIGVRFNVSWENSWRISSGVNNWDAAWIFIKYRTAGDSWHNASLDPANFIEPAGSTILPSADSSGVFIYRNSDGTGTNIFENVKLQWNYGINGVSDEAVVDIKVFGIEMVYITQGSFYAGSGGNETSAFYKYPEPSNPFLITSEDEIIVGTAVDNLYYSSSQFGGDQQGPLPDAFPKGYNAFYCMKYEISQQGYVDFLNTINPTQAARRYFNQGTAFRYGVSRTSGVYSTSNPFLPCSYLNWADLTAYLDWSCLRPLTELEFEKTCRGTLQPVPNEYAWGTTAFTGLPYTIVNSGNTDESISENYKTDAGNAACNLTTPYGGNINGPLRTGIFAANDLNSGRVTAGAAYYGAMEMSGNLLEHFVTVGNPAGRNFTGTHGNGDLDSLGKADVLSWPDATSLGAGFRGGYWYYYPWYMRVSERSGAAGTDPSRYSSDGGRGGRTAP